MELIKAVSRRTKLGEITYDILNVAYAVLLLVLVLTFDPPILAFALVLLSKWRVFAVRPRFWKANIQSNLIDTIVGLSTVGLLWILSGQLPIQIAITALFAAWLVIVKPRSKKKWILIQAAVGQIAGLTVLFSITHLFSETVLLRYFPDILTIAVAALIGYAAARHALTAYNSESERTFLSLAWAFVVAELAWLSYHWTIAYVIGPQLAVPEIVIITALISFVAITLYDAHENDGKIEFKELRWPIIFSGLVLILLLARFSGLDVTQL